jgi:NAD(P)H-quinone oxidoreductase subunit K
MKRVEPEITGAYLRAPSQRAALAAAGSIPLSTAPAAATAPASIPASPSTDA